MDKFTRKYSFLCKGRDGYYIFLDVPYRTGGKDLKFEDLKDDLKECNYIALTPSGTDASMIVEALNNYEESDTVTRS